MCDRYFSFQICQPCGGRDDFWPSSLISSVLGRTSIWWIPPSPLSTNAHTTTHTHTPGSGSVKFRRAKKYKPPLLSLYTHTCTHTKTPAHANLEAEVAVLGGIRNNAMEWGYGHRAIAVGSCLNTFLFCIRIKITYNIHRYT